jgi:Ala-tRNA(Pro) deacylase
MLINTSFAVETAKDHLQAYLREHGVCFTLRHHPTAVTAQQVAACEQISGDQLAKPVIAVVDGRKVMLVLPASYLVNLEKVRAALGAHDVQLADEDELTRIFADCEMGALPPFGNLYGLDVYVDETITRDKHIEFRAGTHTDTIGVQYADFARLVQPKVIDFARHH